MNKPSMETRHKACMAILKQYKQDHAFRWWDEITAPQREQLLTDLESIPWMVVDPLIQSHVLNNPGRSIPTDLFPPDVYPQTPDAKRGRLYEDARQLGRNLIAEGKIAAFTVAGGQATRLGFEGPKGTITVSPVRGKTLFQLFAETIRAVRGKYGVATPWYIMTNPANHEQTIGFLKDHACFDLPENDVFVFSQEMLPVFDFQGRLLMEDKHRVSLAPDGHGGSLKSLASSGALKDMQARGIEIISYFQVDNPLVKPFDPLFIGLHAKTGSQMSTKVAPKADDRERVGNVCLHDGKLTVIEYTDFQEELARARNADGTRKFNAANLAIHLLDVGFVERIGRRFALPYHRAEKSITWMDENGIQRTPVTPNAVKLETFVFDALPLAKNPLVLEVDRAEEFSPVKNAKGVDSVETAIRDQIHRAARWLESVGVTIPRKPNGEPDVTIEIAPSYALDADEVKRRIARPMRIQPGETITFI